MTDDRIIVVPAPHERVIDPSEDEHRQAKMMEEMLFRQLGDCPQRPEHEFEVFWYEGQFHTWHALEGEDGKGLSFTLELVDDLGPEGLIADLRDWHSAICKQLSA